MKKLSRTKRNFFSSGLKIFGVVAAHALASRFLIGCKNEGIGGGRAPEPKNPQNPQNPANCVPKGVPYRTLQQPLNLNLVDSKELPTNSAALREKKILKEGSLAENIQKSKETSNTDETSTPDDTSKIVKTEKGESAAPQENYLNEFQFAVPSGAFHLYLQFTADFVARNAPSFRFFFSTDKKDWLPIEIFSASEESNGNYFFEGRFSALLVTKEQSKNLFIRLEGVTPEAVEKIELQGEQDDLLPLSLAEAVISAFAPEGFSSKPVGIEIISRAAWAAKPQKEKPSYGNWKKIVFHHSARYSAPGEDPGAILRSYQEDHMKVKGWNDIGYNFLIAPDGRVFEGRNGGKNTEGAHVKGANAESLGINLMGQFHSTEPGSKNTPSQQALESAALLAAWLAKECNIDLSGSSNLQGGSQVVLPNVTMHKDVGATFPGGGTACPGNLMYEKVSEIKNNAQEYFQKYYNSPQNQNPAPAERSC